jgi:hypothetical protein
MRARWLLLPLLFTLACEQPGARVRDTGPREPPAWLRRHFRDSEITPFTGYTVAGVDLFEVNWEVMDAGSAFVVGLGQRDGKLVAGPQLFVRIARERLPAEELARRAHGLAVPKESSRDRILVSPAQCTGALFRPTGRCAVVEAPKVENGVLVFYAFRTSHMERFPVEHRVVLATGEHTMRTDLEIFRERGLPVDIGAAECRVMLVDGALPPTATHRRLDAESTTSYLTSVDKCEGRTCFVSFAEDGVYRLDALAPLGETCARVARPSEAPFVCVQTVTNYEVTACTRAPRPPPAP